MFAHSYILAKISLILAEHFPEDKVEQWLKNAKVIECTDDGLIMYIPSHESLISLKEYCQPYILEFLKNLFRCNVTLEILGPRELEQYNRNQEKKPDYLRPGFLFSDFVVGNSNEMAVKIAKAVAKTPGDESYNPLYFFGPSGTGKTHLLCAIANEIHIKNPELNVCYVLADVFIGELIWSLRSGTHDAFRRKYRSLDVLIVEDVQFLAGKAIAQEEFYYLFDYLYQNHKQLIFSANAYPSALPNMEQYLSTKFEQGVVIGMTTPDIHIRMTIVSQLAQKYKLRISNEVVLYIAETLPGSIRKIAGAMKELRAERDLGNAEISLELVKNILQVIE